MKIAVILALSVVCVSGGGYGNGGGGGGAGAGAGAGAGHVGGHGGGGYGAGSGGYGGSGSGAGGHGGGSDDSHNYYAPAFYNFGYDVSDQKTYVNMGHTENRNGDTTKGAYYVHLPDGRLQKTEYVVSGKSGYLPKVTYQQTGAAYGSSGAGYGGGYGGGHGGQGGHYSKGY